MALFQFPVFQTLAGAILASTAIVAGVIGIAARAPLANLVSGVMLAFAQPVRLGDYISVRRGVRHGGGDHVHVHVHPHRPTAGTW